MDELLRRLVWLDYRLAVVFLIAMPVGLWGWAIAAKSQLIGRALAIYARVASLLVVTLYLAIASFPISFLTGMLGRVLVGLALWYWRDINEDLAALKGRLGFVYRVWRWGTTAYLSFGVAIAGASVGCGFTPVGALGGTCAYWLEPPLAFRAIVHANIPVETLGFAGLVGLALYGLYFAGFVLFTLPKQGRVAFRE